MLPKNVLQPQGVVKKFIECREKYGYYEVNINFTNAVYGQRIAFPWELRRTYKVHR